MASRAELLALLADGPAKEKLKRNTVLVRTSPGTLEWQDSKGQNKGQFDGRAGSLRRSRKGNVTRALNGRRAYVPEDNWWDEQGPQVVAY